jgi:hypothetical protein
VKNITICKNPSNNPSRTPKVVPKAVSDPEDGSESQRYECTLEKYKKSSGDPILIKYKTS